jgi:hypothetical protein
MALVVEWEKICPKCIHCPLALDNNTKARMCSRLTIVSCKHCRCRLAIYRFAMY